ncbi:hypothetical protein SLS60_011095 [Paraconiothyrium brasiliense]|uniref:Uncharacterized protein n=1 Tax=Paraconiothyrium brasiliense TaxID=300254 RepID=A0ABR3QL83_9PLEO
MSSHEPSDDTPPAVPPRSSQRDSLSNSTSNRDSLYRASPQISPVQPSHPAIAESSSTDPVPPQVPQKTVQPQSAPTTQPTQAQQVQNLFPMAAQTETIKTKRQELEEGDAHWKWKIGFRAISIIVGLIGIGCAAWITAHFTGSLYSYSYSYYYFDDAVLVPWTLITFALSVVWSAACVIIFFARHLNAPMHPGAQVGCDLILWLGFAVTGSFAVIGTMDVGSFGSDGTLGYFSSSSGDYTQASNGTWVWTSSSSSSSYYSSSTRSCETGSGTFSTCAQQDAYVNALFHSKTQRYNLDLAATVCQFIALLMHLILFIWACVDTQRRNSRSVSKDAEKLAADIVMNMVKSGAIIPAPGQAHFPPMAQQGAPMGFVYPQQQYQPYPQQQYPGQYTTPVAQGKAPIPQPAVASSSNEKGAGPRYA